MAQSAGALIRSPSHSRRAEARRRLARHSLWLVAGLTALIIVLMFVFDAKRDRLDAEARLAGAVAGPHLHRFR